MLHKWGGGQQLSISEPYHSEILDKVPGFQKTDCASSIPFKVENCIWPWHSFQLMLCSLERSFYSLVFDWNASSLYFLPVLELLRLHQWEIPRKKAQYAPWRMRSHLLSQELSAFFENYGNCCAMLQFPALFLSLVPVLAPISDGTELTTNSPTLVEFWEPDCIIRTRHVTCDNLSFADAEIIFDYEFGR